MCYPVCGMVHIKEPLLINGKSSPCGDSRFLLFYMHHPTDRIAHTTAFVTPVVEHWLEREIAQWVHPMKDRSDDSSLHERTLLPPSYISLHHHYEWTKIRRFVQRAAETARARPRLHDRHARWRFLSSSEPIELFLVPASASRLA